MSGLVVEGLSLRRGGFALRVESVRAEPGSVTGVFGPSGAGKTTLLEAVAGLVPVEAGSIALGGRTLCRPARGVSLPPRERRVGYVPQDGALFPHLDVRGNLLFGARRAVPVPDRWDDVVRVLELGALVGRAVGTLSGGEARRVALGRALLAGPEALLLDEPLAGLDASRRARILRHLDAVRAEFSLPMLFISHDAAEVASLCGRVVVLDAGAVVAQGRPAEVLG